MTEDPLFGSSIYEEERTTLHWEGPLESPGGLARWLGPVRDLDLEDCRLDAATLQVLLDAAPNLIGLRLVGAGLDAGSMNTLACHPRAASLQRLDLSHNRCGPEGLARLRGLDRLLHLQIDPQGEPLGPFLAGLPSLVSLSVSTRGWAGFGSGPGGLTRLEVLWGGYAMGEAGARELAGSPIASQVHELTSRGQRLGEEGLAALLRLPYLSRLRLGNNLLADGSAAKLVGRSWVCLDLTDNELTPAGVRRLAGLTGLEELRLSGKQLGEAGVELARGPALAGLHTLELRHTGLSDASLEALAASPVGLSQLELEGRFTDRGLQALLEAPWAPGLRHLVLRGACQGEALAERELPRLESLELELQADSPLSVSRLLNRQPALRRLTLSSWPAGAAEDGPARLERLRVHQAAGRLEPLPQLRQLRVLQLGRSTLTDGDVARWLPGLPRLEVLELESCRLTDQTARTLAETPNRLRRLDLRLNEICRGARALAESPHLARIERLDMRGNPLREDEDIWYDQGFPIGSTPPDPEALELRRRFGPRLRL